MDYEWSRFNERNKFGKLLTNDKCEFIELVMAETGLAIKRASFYSYNLTIKEMENLIINSELAASFDSFFELHNEKWLLPLFSALFDSLLNVEPNIYFVSRDFNETIKEIEQQTSHNVDLTLML